MIDVYVNYSFVIHYLVEERVGQNGRVQFYSEKQDHKFLGLVIKSFSVHIAHWFVVPQVSCFKLAALKYTVVDEIALIYCFVVPLKNSVNFPVK
jgi:hypothetical protein